MLLKLDTAPRRMKLVFQLARELEKSPQKIELAQALTRNHERPLMGLKGTHGLYGSDEWWANVLSGKMKTQRVSGIVESTYFAGQDSRWGNEVNSFKLRVDGREPVGESIYCSAKADRKRFAPGAFVMIAYAFDELKKQPAEDGSVNYARVVLEMAVSVD